MSKNGEKVKIDSDNWFPSLPNAENGKMEVKEWPIDDIYPFKDCPFKIRDDPEMAALIDSVAENGVMLPILARWREGKSGIETIDGLRRLQAAIMAGLETAPAIVVSMDDDAATIFMVDTKLAQRTNILPSERAFAYKMKFDALKRQGKRNDLTSSQDETKLKGRTTTIMASQSEDSRAQIDRYIHLTNLITPLLDMVDNKVIDFVPAVDLSYLKREDEQIWVGCAIESYGKITGKQAALMKQMHNEKNLTESAIEAIMRTEQPLDMKVTLRGQTLQKYFPKDYTPKQMQEVIIKLLEGWKKEHQRDDIKLVR